MVFLNGQPFPVYGIDTQETRVRRAALMMKTHPLFLSTEPKELADLDNDTNVIAVNLLDLMKTSAETGDFVSFYREIDGMYGASFDVILHMWLKFVPDLDNSIDMITMIIENEFPGVNVRSIREYQGNDQTSEIRNFLEEQSRIENELQNFNSDIIPVEMSEIEVQKITFEVKFNLDVDLVEIFDRLKVSPELPYVNNGGDRHKIYRNFKNIGVNWEFGMPTRVQFFVLNTRFPPSKFQEKAYSQGVIALAETRGEAIMQIETVVGAKNNLEDLLSRVFSSLQIDQKSVIKISQHSINSVVNIPKQRFNKYILADIISNDPLVSSLCYIDESVKIGRIRSSVSFFYQPTGAENRITISFTETPVELKEYRRNPQMYPMDSRYIRVHINKVKNEETTKEIANFIGRVFKIYLDKKDEIAQVYSSYIPGFAELEEKKTRGGTQRGTRLQDIVPDVFIPGYARACQNPPSLADELVKPILNRANNFIITSPTPQHTQALLFPKTPEEGPQHWYVCPPGKYPGLRVNSLGNSAKFPYLPCCYPIDQTAKKNYKNYYLDYDIKDDTSVYTHILTTPKFLNKGELGTVPSNLDSLFQNLMREKMEFYRTGTPRSPYSFIDAVSIAMGRQLIRKNVSDEMFAACRQNAFGMSITQLKEKFMDPEEYINPAVYYRALEEYFNCYIYLFTRTEGQQGAVMYPLHRHTFLRYKRDSNRPIVMILEHMGAESDAAVLPQSEIIIATVSSKNSERTMFFSGEFANKIDTMYKNTIQWYSGLMKIEDVDPNLFKNITSQGIDSLGKTRSLAVSLGKRTVYVITDPLPPLTLLEKSSFANNSIETINEFIRIENLELVSITPDRYIVRKGGRMFYLPYSVTGKTTLGVYNQNQRIARYLQEYTYHMYSIYARKHGMNPNNINTFLREKTIVKANYSYPKVSRRFDLNGPYLEKERLIVHNLEMAQRLGYSVELMMRRNQKLLEDYAGFDLIQEYYLDKNDFTTDNNTVILMTDEALRNWIEEKDVEYNLHIIPTSTEKTFYLSFQEKVVLIQLAESFEAAVYASKVWNEEHYNGSGIIEDSESDYSYYIFETPEKITQFGVSPNRVLVWREEDQLYYGAILDSP